MVFKDQLGRTVALKYWPPRRIISLVPSQTELLADLGLEKEVVGITKFCVRPAKWFQTKTRVGGTKTIDFQKIEVLQPDLIIGNKEENEQSQIEQLAQKFPVWMSDIYTLDHALDMIRRVGNLVSRAETASAVVTRIQSAFSLFNEQLGENKDAVQRVAYLIWRKPFMVAAGGTFIDNMLHLAGFENAFEHLSRYPEVSPEQLAAVRPEVIFLSSEPYLFSEKHFPALREICPNAQIQLVDGEIFSWYGSRLQQAPAYFIELRGKLT